MRGSVIRFDEASGNGLISGDDGKRYDFSERMWSDRSNRPAAGVTVDFETHGQSAKDIFAVRSTPAPAGARSNTGEASNNGNLLGGLSIGAALLGFVPAFGFIFSVAGLILGIIARKQGKAANNNTGKLMGGIGIALSCIIFALELIAVIFLGALFAGAGSSKMW
jgi:hypothetical protein